MSVFAVQGQIAVQGKAMSIKQAIQVIEKNSKYTFFYKAADLTMQRSVTSIVKVP
jgi:hypothetical protein